MKKIIAILLLCSAVFSFVCAEEGQRQIGYRILTDYLTVLKDDSGRKIGGAVTMGIGFTLTLASVGAYVWGDEISAAFNDGTAWDESNKYIVSGSLLGSGLLTTGIGAAVFFSKPGDPFIKYASIFNEPDPLVQEALAVAALRGLSQEGKERRILNGISSMSVPVLTVVITAIANVTRGVDWDDNLAGISVWHVGSFVNGFSKIFFEKSKGEKVYEKYLAAREALFSSER